LLNGKFKDCSSSDIDIKECNPADKKRYIKRCFRVVGLLMTHCATILYSREDPRPLLLELNREFLSENISDIE
jgi:hypothetical protein